MAALTSSPGSDPDRIFSMRQPCDQRDVSPRKNLAAAALERCAFVCSETSDTYVIPSGTPRGISDAGTLPDPSEYLGMTASDCSRYIQTRTALIVAGVGTRA